MRVLISADLAVVIGNEIDFFARNNTPVGHASIAEAVALTGITYDDTTRTMYLSDVRNNVSIFSNNLTERNFTSKPLLKSKYRAHSSFNYHKRSNPIIVSRIFWKTFKKLHQFFFFNSL